MKALFIHPDGNTDGNILWPIRPTSDELKQLENARDVIAAKGYWASFFPEGDGIVFSKDSYDPRSSLADFRRCFSFVDFQEVAGSNVGTALGALVPGAMVAANCLVPVTGLRLLNTFSIGKTTFHAAVDGRDVKLADHRWGKSLCDVVGADVIDDWCPVNDLYRGTTTNLLAYALMEREVMIPAKLFYEARDSVSGQERLLNFIIQDADRALDLLRWANCSFKRLEYLPNKAGWIDDFAYAYVMPSLGPMPDLYSAKPQVLRVENNWLGLEVGHDPDDEETNALAKIIDGLATDLISINVKSALRVLGQAFYLVDPEASFLSMVYAIDALSEVGRLQGERQRAWVAASASNGDAQKFGECLPLYQSLYEVRNRIVHDGETFATLDVDSKCANQQIMVILCGIIENIVRSQFASREHFVDQILERLQQPGHVSVLKRCCSKDITYPIAADKTFKKVIDRRTTSS